MSRASAHSWVSTHVPHFKGSCNVYVAASIQTYKILIPGKHPCGPKSRVTFKRSWALTQDTTVNIDHILPRPLTLCSCAHEPKAHGLHASCIEYAYILKYGDFCANDDDDDDDITDYIIPCIQCMHGVITLVCASVGTALVHLQRILVGRRGREGGREGERETESRWYMYLNVLLFPNLASYQSMAVDTQYGYNRVDTMDQTSLTNGFSILTSSITRHKVRDDTCMKCIIVTTSLTWMQG